MGLLDIADRLVNGRDAHVESWTTHSDRDRLIAMRLEIYEQSKANRGSGSLKKTHAFKDPSLKRIAFLTETEASLHYMSTKDQVQEAERLARFADRLDKDVSAGLVKDEPEAIRKAYGFEKSLSMLASVIRSDDVGMPADSYVAFKGMMDPEREIATVKALQGMSRDSLELLQHGVFEAIQPRHLRPLAAAVRDDPTSPSGGSSRKEVQSEGPRQAPVAANMGRGGTGR